MNEYRDVIRYFRHVNDIVIRRGRHEERQEDVQWLAKHHVSQIALQASARIYGVS